MTQSRKVFEASAAGPRPFVYNNYWKCHAMCFSLSMCDNTVILKVNHRILGEYEHQSLQHYRDLGNKACNDRHRYCRGLLQRIPQDRKECFLLHLKDDAYVLSKIAGLGKRREVVRSNYTGDALQVLKDSASFGDKAKIYWVLVRNEKGIREIRVSVRGYSRRTSVKFMRFSEGFFRFDEYAGDQSCHTRPNGQPFYDCMWDEDAAGAEWEWEYAFPAGFEVGDDAAGGPMKKDEKGQLFAPGKGSLFDPEHGSESGEYRSDSGNDSHADDSSEYYSSEDDLEEDS